MNFYSQYQIKMHPKHLMTRNSRSYFDLSAQVNYHFATYSPSFAFSLLCCWRKFNIHSYMWKLSGDRSCSHSLCCRNSKICRRSKNVQWSKKTSCRNIKICKLIKLVTDFNFDYQFCESLSNLLKPKSGVPSESQDYVDQCDASIKKQDAE